MIQLEFVLKIVCGLNITIIFNFHKNFIKNSIFMHIYLLNSSHMITIVRVNDTR